jgi:16S rRNA (cytidine1402-2'-O)-methyltransferase
VSAGKLSLVATPIGNLEDVTLRALRALREADLLLAEDTRRVRKLLDRHGITARPVSLHAHNEARRRGEALAALASGAQVALVSDAGTPLVSDPGERLVEAVIAAGYAVEAVPGPSAVLAALVVSGLPAARFAFQGFLPRRAGERGRLLARLRALPETLVLFESPRRIAATLRELAAALGPRRACVARELTKLHEEVARGTLPELAQRFAAGARGELAIVVEGTPATRSEPGAAERDVDPHAREALDPGALDAEIASRLAAGARAREIAAALAPATGLPRRALYARVLALARRGRAAG